MKASFHGLPSGERSQKNLSKYLDIYRLHGLQGLFKRSKGSKSSSPEEPVEPVLTKDAAGRPEDRVEDQAVQEMLQAQISQTPKVPETPGEQALQVLPELPEEPDATDVPEDQPAQTSGSPNSVTDAGDVQGKYSIQNGNRGEEEPVLEPPLEAPESKTDVGELLEIPDISGVQEGFWGDEESAADAADTASPAESSGKDGIGEIEPSLSPQATTAAVAAQPLSLPAPASIERLERPRLVFFNEPVDEPTVTASKTAQKASEPTSGQEQSGTSSRGNFQTMTKSPEGSDGAGEIDAASKPASASSTSRESPRRRKKNRENAWVSQMEDANASAAAMLDDLERQFIDRSGPWVAGGIQRDPVLGCMVTSDADFAAAVRAKGVERDAILLALRRRGKEGGRLRLEWDAKAGKILAFGN